LFTNVRDLESVCVVMYLLPTKMTLWKLRLSQSQTTDYCEQGVNM